jgi:hypothetical protein
LAVLRAASTLLELEDSDRLEVRIVVRVVFVWLRTLSIDEELLESWLELVFTAPRAVSTLEDELDKLRLEV